MMLNRLADLMGNTGSLVEESPFFPTDCAPSLAVWSAKDTRAVYTYTGRRSVLLNVRQSQKRFWLPTGRDGLQSFGLVA
jgi:hypothetical protein